MNWSYRIGNAIQEKRMRTSFTRNDNYKRMGEKKNEQCLMWDKIRVVMTTKTKIGPGFKGL